MARYDEDAIQVLEGLEPVRKKPGMYVGTTDSKGIYQIFKEPFDNATDEADNGHGKIIRIWVDTKKKLFTLSDEGRGIPVGIHAKTKISTLTTVLTKLHAGGKIEGNKAYNTSKGTFGVGVSITNALSSYFQIWTKRDGAWHTQEFSKGKPKSKVKISKPPFKQKCGTIVRFSPDYSIFEGAFPVKEIHLLVKNAAYFHSAKFELDIDGKKTTYYFKEGPKAFIAAKIKKLEAEAIGKPIFIKSSDLTFIGQWTDSPDDHFETYVNGSITVRGGTHFNMFNNLLNKAMKTIAKKKDTFKPEDLRVGLVGFLSVNVRSPQFDSQLKECLKSKEGGEIVAESMSTVFTDFVKKQKSTAKAILSRAVEMRALHKEFSLSKKTAAKLDVKKKGKIFLPEKLATSTGSDIDKRELFLVEGDSAGGKAKIARDRTYQEVLALRGKILNVYKAKDEKIGDSKEVIDILQSIGYQPKLKDPFSQLRVGKVIFLADSDEDGRHISLLLSGLMQKVLSPLIEQGRVFSVVGPLFTTQHRGKKVYGDTIKELEEQTKSKNMVVTRLKGWGEATIDMLQDSALNPQTRKLIKLEPISGKQLKEFQAILAEDTEVRRKLLGLSS